ncbi:hypothetical protein M408DRAFT_27541 [Serendipita vermifera MAFF 305830]|uniref:Uncharacterized protein n=1 Tax=Serendipita vermifera MAFF 305830 TaxID=933852 RepID=A0A0C2X2Z7_SERVB|nr:hypothetical protein M408DRAFT_27541 [Serendipita vermifera MAFF 305830]
MASSSLAAEATRRSRGGDDSISAGATAGIVVAGLLTVIPVFIAFVAFLVRQNRRQAWYAPMGEHYRTVTTRGVGIGETP